MMTQHIQELEHRLGLVLPQDYRQFLIGHEHSLLEQSLVFKTPRSGVVDELLTAQRIVQNDDKGQIGIPERSLLHIGGNLMGGYLYLDVSIHALGQVHYMENYQFQEQFASFTAFLDQTEPECSS